MADTPQKDAPSPRQKRAPQNEANEESGVYNPHDDPANKDFLEFVEREQLTADVEERLLHQFTPGQLDGLMALKESKRPSDRILFALIVGLPPDPEDVKKVENAKVTYQQNLERLEELGLGAVASSALVGDIGDGPSADMLVSAGMTRAMLRDLNGEEDVPRPRRSVDEKLQGSLAKPSRMKIFNPPGPIFGED